MIRWHSKDLQMSLTVYGGELLYRGTQHRLEVVLKGIALLP
jgi:hypothetical protein